MSHMSFSATLIRLYAFKKILVFRPKINFFPRFLAKNDEIFGTPHSSLIYVPRDLRVS